MDINYVMPIGFIIDSEKGQRIIGGADSKYSLNNLQGIGLVGKKIIVKSSFEEEYCFTVIDMSISTSIAGGINLGYTLYP